MKNKNKNFSFIIVAGGNATRMGGLKKQFILLDKRPVWKWSAETAAGLYEYGINEIILVLPENDININPEWKNNSVQLKITKGGNDRSSSVLNGLEIAKSDYVLVHDAARPFVTKNLLIELMKETSDERTGAIPLLPVSDALKKIENDTEISCVERDGLYITQTPQSFHKLNLINAIIKNPGAKDEAEAWLKIPGNILKKVDGERLNFKITWQDDMKIAESIVEKKLNIRTGIGWDIHRLVPERKLILGGVLIDSNLGLLGHSDADALVHAIMDAILGAAGLPDIGNLFPATDEKFKNADSMKLLKKVIEIVKENNFEIEWIDSIIQAQVPRLNIYINEMKNKLENLIGKGKVNIKAKSFEKIDDSGAGLSIMCQAIATLSGGI